MMMSTDGPASAGVVPPRQLRVAEACERPTPPPASARPRRRTVATVPRVARVFDGCTDGKPWFAAARTLIVSPAEREELLALLADGTPLLRSAPLRDTVTGEADAVPSGLRTDGTWVWCDASAYYLDQHWIAPDPDLIAHLRVRGALPPIDAQTRGRLYAALRPDSWESTTWPLD